jgi:hypothetical protein
MGKPRISQKRSSGRTDVERDVEMFLAIQQVDQIADYASRGRVHERLTDQQLGKKWVGAFRRCAHAPSDEQRRAIENDLKAEFQLRSIEPPYEQVKLEIDRIVAGISSGFEKMKRDDPDAVAEMAEEFEQDIADLKVRMKRPN